MKAILMALLMVVSFSILGCGEEEKTEVEKGKDKIKKVVTTEPAKAKEAEESGKKAVDDAKKDVKKARDD